MLNLKSIPVKIKENPCARFGMTITNPRAVSLDKYLTITAQVEFKEYSNSKLRMDIALMNDNDEILLVQKGDVFLASAGFFLLEESVSQSHLKYRYPSIYEELAYVLISPITPFVREEE